MKNIEIQIVNRIAELRKAKGMTITDLASKAGLSPSQISRIERHHVSPPISTLSEIADALNAKVIDFFKDEEENLSFLVHRNQDAYERIEHGGKTYHIPFYSNIYRMMEPVIFVVPPHTSLVKEMRHAGEEYMYILEGSVDFLYGREVYHLERHDSVYYKGNIPHGTFNDGDAEGTVLSVVTSRQNLYNGVMVHRLLKEAPSDELRPYDDA